MYTHMHINRACTRKLLGGLLLSYVSFVSEEQHGGVDGRPPSSKVLRVTGC